MNVFLSGAVEGEADFGFSWRAIAAEFLEQQGYRVLCPVNISLENKFNSVNEIVHKNHHMQEKADIVLAEYNIPNRCYVGTDYELTHARIFNQPAIIWAHEMYRNRVYLRYLATAILPSLEECLSYIQTYYPPE